jgi:hypothetical protein
MKKKMELSREAGDRAEGRQESRMKQIELDKLQAHLEEFGAKLSPILLEEFRQIIFSIGAFHNSVGDIYKYAEIALLPKTAVGAAESSTALPQQTFKPPVKQDLASIAMTLARNLELNLKKE